MANPRFQIWLEARYKGESNGVTRLALFQNREGGWQPFSLNESSPGFTLMCYSILAGQHECLRAAAADHGLVMSSASGEIVVRAGLDWRLRATRIVFDVELAAGNPDPGVVADISNRLKRCPVARNLPIDVETHLKFAGS